VREAWLLVQDRRRRMAAVAYAAAIYLALFLSAWGFGLLDRDKLPDMPGTLLVSLNEEEIATGAVPLGRETLPERPPEVLPEAPAPAAAKPAAVVAAPAPKPATAKPAPPAPPKTAAAKPAIPEPAAAKPAIPEPTAAKPAIPEPTAAKPAIPEPAAAKPATPEPTATTAPQPTAPAVESATPATAAAPESAAVQSAAVQPVADQSTAVAAAAEPYIEEPPAPPVSKTYGSPAAATGGIPGVARGSGSVTFRGTEKGNSLETAFGASTGTIGRSLYVPIYGYMPLPARVSGAVYGAIPADKDGFYSAESRKKTFAQYYQAEGETWRLKAPVPLERRLALWLMLEDAGYDLAHADYKDGLAANGVTIEFAVGPASGSAKPALIDLGIASSSGSSEIDAAVLYGFRQAAFFNKNAFAVSGKFTYRFGK
jgi:hypothetical protein